MFFWLRVLWSFGLLGFSLAVTIAALFEGKTTMWDGVPEIVSLILFFGLMSVVGMLEGMQIAFFYVVARVTTQNVGEGQTNVLGLPDPVQNFLNFGFQGALITTILGSITWQLVAAVFPVAFLSTPFT